jgi:hypothetical protein
MIEYRNKIFYITKPLMPRWIQLFLRKRIVSYQLKRNKDIWPIDEKAGAKPPGWQGWPDGKKFALVLTHDVESAKGHERCLDLMKLELKLGFRSSFNFVPLRYSVSPEVLQTLRSKGFEVGVHGLYHDGKYYITKSIFSERAAKINQYLKDWQAVGYRAPSMYHKLDLFHELNIEYDTSTFDTDPFEPSAIGIGSIFPFYVLNRSGQKGYIELPYTLPQDFTLFILMSNNSNEIWKKKLDWVVEHGGMVLMDTHPDYMNYSTGKSGKEEYPASYYEDFLKHIKEKYSDQYWHPLPKDMARFWKENCIME